MNGGKTEFFVKATAAIPAAIGLFFPFCSNNVNIYEKYVVCIKIANIFSLSYIYQLTNDFFKFIHSINSSYVHALFHATCSLRENFIIKFFSRLLNIYSFPLTADTCVYFDVVRTLFPNESLLTIPEKGSQKFATVKWVSAASESVFAQNRSTYQHQGFCFEKTRRYIRGCIRESSVYVSDWYHEQYTWIVQRNGDDAQTRIPSRDQGRMNSTSLSVRLCSETAFLFHCGYRFTQCL